jgi:uncharacterized protein with PIN domain
MSFVFIYRNFLNSDIKDALSASGDEIANALWVAANTKRCPRCNTPIEKDEGCNHMRSLFFLFFITMIITTFLI